MRPGPTDAMQADLFQEQVDGLQAAHFLVLCWAAAAEDRHSRYNITNCFDDLKYSGITRTKQSAVSVIEALAVLRFIELRDEGNRRHIFITRHGARALENLVLKRKFTPVKSYFLEGSKP